MRESLPLRDRLPRRGGGGAKRQRGNGGCASAQTEGETVPLAAAKSQALSPHPLTRDYFVAGPLCRWRDISPRCGESPSQRGPFSKVAAFSAVTIYLSLYLIPRPCATVFERKRLLFVVFWVAWRWKAESTFAVTRYYPIPCNCQSAFRPAHFLIDNLNSRIVKYSEIMKF